MRFQDQLVKTTQRSLDDVCRSALAVPVARHDWSPGGLARSVLSQMREVATSATYFLPLVESGISATFNDETRREHKRFRQTFATVEECVREARQSTAQLCQAILSFADRDLEREVMLPFSPSLYTMADVLGLHHWNLVYHLGQINSIQLMLGDADMH